MMKMVTSLMCAGLTALVSGQAFQQEIPPEDKKVADEQAVSFFTTLREVTRPVSQVVFPIYSYRQRIGYGISLGEDRLLVKWSELARAPQLVLPGKDGQGIKVAPVGVYPEHDLAVVKAEGLNAPKAEWADGSKLAAGSFLAAVDERGEASGLGVVSVPARSLREEDQGYLGTMMSLRTFDEGVMVQRVVPRTAARRVGIRRGDIITSINGQKINGFYELSSILRRLVAGSQPKIEVLRDGKKLHFQPTLDERRDLPESSQLQTMDQMSGSQSRVRDEFPNVMQSDMALEADQNGLPIVDLDGRIVGMVIARAGRISTLILPGEVIAKELETEPEPVKVHEWSPRRQIPRGNDPRNEQMRRALDFLFGR